MELLLLKITMLSGHGEHIDCAAPNDFGEDFNLGAINNLSNDGIVSDLASTQKEKKSAPLSSFLIIDA